MTNLPIEQLVTVAKSWNYPPNLELSEGYLDQGYDRGQRAFVIARSVTSERPLEIDIAASDDQPLHFLPGTGS